MITEYIGTADSRINLMDKLYTCDESVLESTTFQYCIHMISCRAYNGLATDDLQRFRYYILTSIKNRNFYFVASAISQLNALEIHDNFLSEELKALGS